MKKPTQNNKIIEVKDLVKQYKGAKENSVNNVSFYVDEGTFFSLLGPNGAGKTTTISILTTLLSATSGKIEIAGWDVSKQANQVRSEIGVIFQNPSLDVNLTAEENIRFHANLYNLYPYRPSFSLMPKAYQEKVESLTSILGLEQEIFQPVKTLSGGMKRKLEIIRSLMHEPRVLFLDEPTTGLDPVSRNSLWQYIQKIQKQEKVTIFLTTHYLEEAEKSDYICIINHGQVVSKGTPSEITEDLVEEYILVDSEKPKQLLEEIKQKQWKVSGSGPYKIQLNGKQAAAMVQSIKTPLNRLVINRPTLEEAYLRIIKAS